VQQLKRQLLKGKPSALSTIHQEGELNMDVQSVLSNKNSITNRLPAEVGRCGGGFRAREPEPDPPFQPAKVQHEYNPMQEGFAMEEIKKLQRSMTTMTTKVKMLTAVRDTVDALAEKIVELESNLMTLAHNTVGAEKFEEKT